MTLGVSDLQWDSDLDSIRNSCDVFRYLIVCLCIILCARMCTLSRSQGDTPSLRPPNVSHHHHLLCSTSITELKNIFKGLTLLRKKLLYNLLIIGIWDSFIVFCCDICRNLSKGYVWWQNKYNHHQMTRLATTHSQMCNKQKILLQESQMKNIFKIMTAFVVLVGEFRLNCRFETRGEWWWNGVGAAADIMNFLGI